MSSLLKKMSWLPSVLRRSTGHHGKAFKVLHDTVPAHVSKLIYHHPPGYTLISESTRAGPFPDSVPLSHCSLRHECPSRPSLLTVAILNQKSPNVICKNPVTTHTHAFFLQKRSTAFHRFSNGSIIQIKFKKTHKKTSGLFPLKVSSDHFFLLLFHS